jgi:uncharacterized protein CbrC (UPF0167 family)
MSDFDGRGYRFASYFEPCRCGRTKTEAMTFCDSCLAVLPATLSGVAFWADVLNDATPWRLARYKIAEKFLEESGRFTTGKVPDWSDAKELFQITGSPYHVGLGR